MEWNFQNKSKRSWNHFDRFLKEFLVFNYWTSRKNWIVDIVILFPKGSWTLEFYDEVANAQDAYRYYFSRELIEETKTTIGPRSFSFMGEFVADSRMKFRDADEYQRHFMQVIEGGRANKSRPNNFLDFFRPGPHEWSYRLDAHKTDHSKSAEVQFCTNAKRHLAQSPWAAMIDECLESK